MPKFDKILLTRADLAKFLPDQRSVKEFERLFSQDEELSILVTNIVEGVGLNDDGTYIIPSGTNFLDISTSIYDALIILDQTTSTTLIINVNINSALDAESQSVLVNATSGDIDITLPDPSSCFDNNRSFRIGITKVDTTTNVVNILPFASELVVGETSQVLLLDGEVLNFITDSTNWYLEN